MMYFEQLSHLSIYSRLMYFPIVRLFALKIYIVTTLEHAWEIPANVLVNGLGSFVSGQILHTTI